MLISTLLISWLASN